MEDFYRLLALLEKPAQIPLRAPLIIRDIHCLALSGAGGDYLRALYAPDAAGKRIFVTGKNWNKLFEIVPVRQ